MPMNVDITFAAEMVKCGGANQGTSMGSWLPSDPNHLSPFLDGRLTYSRLHLFLRKPFVSHDPRSANRTD